MGPAGLVSYVQADPNTPGTTPTLMGPWLVDNGVGSQINLGACKRDLVSLRG